MKDTVKKIIIYGGGIGGWTAAHLLTKSLPNNFSIVLIEDGMSYANEPECCTLGPAAIGFFKDLGLTEATLIDQQKGSYRLASHYINLDGSGGEYYLPFCEHGFLLQGRSFSHYAIWERSKGILKPYDDYALSSVVARLGSFAHPSSASKSLLSTIVYGYQLNCSVLMTYLKQESLSAGLQYLVGSLSGGTLSDSGSIDSINISSDDGTVVIKGDFFIDCSGTNASLLSGLLRVPYHDLSEFLPVNKMLRFIEDGAVSPVPFNTVQATQLGWMLEAKSQNLRQVDLLYHDESVSDVDAITQLSKLLSIEPSSISVLHVQPGRRQQFWHKNCLSIGFSASDTLGFGMDYLSLIQSSLQRFLTLLPRGISYEFLAEEYNRLTKLEHEHVVDFASLHFWLAGHVSEYAVKLSDRLMHRIELFEHTGRMPFFEGDPFLQETWVSLLLGAGRWPLKYDVFVDSMDPQWIHSQLEKMSIMIESAASRMPKIERYLQTPKQALVI